MPGISPKEHSSPPTGIGHVRRSRSIRTGLGAGLFRRLGTLRILILGRPVSRQPGPAERLHEAGKNALTDPQVPRRLRAVSVAALQGGPGLRIHDVTHWIVEMRVRRSVAKCDSETLTMVASSCAGSPPNSTAAVIF